MGDFHQPNTPPFDSVEKCRERRQRRIESRRRRMVDASGDRRRRRRSSSSSSSGEEAEVEVAPEYGMVTVAGRMREMEDAVKVCMELCRPHIAACRPVHFFAVFDGHGGSHVKLAAPKPYLVHSKGIKVAELCRQRLHVFLEDELMRTAAGAGAGAGNGKGVLCTAELEADWAAVMRRTFEKIDAVALDTCICGDPVGHCRCGCHPAAVSLTGSTATVAVVTPRHIIVANCGDSRAVLFRRGRAIPLSVDHKPDKPDELARVEAAGGRVIFMDGARVQGILAMSRAIGDKFLKPIVISEPDIRVLKRDPEDECLIIASDGLWDVISNEMACKVAYQCLREGDGNVSKEQDDVGPNLTPTSRSSLAAALLTRLALGRDSTDNISVIVVDLKCR